MSELSLTAAVKRIKLNNKNRTLSLEGSYMLRLVSISILAILLCSCAQKTSLSLDERIAQDQLWLNRLEQLPGTHISQLSDLWGEPTKLRDNIYYWCDFIPPIKIDGHYVEDGYTRSDVYAYTDAGIAESVGYIRTPKERYVPPQYASASLCVIQVTIDENGIISDTAYLSEINGEENIFRCRIDFPFHKE